MCGKSPSSRTLELPLGFLRWLCGRRSDRTHLSLTTSGIRFFCVPHSIKRTPGSPLVPCLLYRGRSLGSRLKALANLWRYVIREGVSSTKTVGNIHPLLPALQFPTVKLLKAAILLKVFVLVVVIIQVQITHFIESARKLTPSTLPLEVSCLSACPPQTRSSPDVEASSIAGMWSSGRNGTRRDKAKVR